MACVSIPVAALVSAGAGVASSAISSGAASSAANTQAQGATNAAQIASNAQLQGLQYVQGQEQPYNTAGQLALNQYESLLGLGGTGGPSAGAVPTSGISARPGQGVPAGSPAATGGKGITPAGTGGFDISKLPGYQFELEQGQQALQNSAAARGQALSGNTIQGEVQFGQGLATTQFQQYMQELAGLTGIGQAAASSTAAAGGNLIPGAGASLAGGVNAAANANAAGQVGVANALTGGLTGVLNNPLVQQSLSSYFNQAPNYDQTATLPASAFGQ